LNASVSSRGMEELIGQNSAVNLALFDLQRATVS
jgi:hypothetical protein